MYAPNATSLRKVTRNRDYLALAISSSSFQSIMPLSDSSILDLAATFNDSSGKGPFERRENLADLWTSWKISAKGLNSKYDDSARTWIRLLQRSS